ncbi:hypothetical protein KA183_20900 [bacterium]|nr:hypothetical protein [bacterium]
MSSISTLLVSDAPSEINSKIEKLIRSHHELNYEAHVSKQLAPESIKGRKNILVWYELDTNPELSLTALQRLVAAHPSSYFIVSKSTMDPELVKTVMKVGVIDFLDYERADVQLKSVIRRISALQDAESRAQAPVNSAALEKRSMLKTSENLMQTGKWADFDFGKLQEGAALADREAELRKAPQAPPQAPAQAAPPPTPAPPPPPAPAPSGSKWGDLDAIGSPGASVAPAVPATPVTPVSANPAPPPPPTPSTASGGNSWGDLDKIPTPKAGSEASAPAPAPGLGQVLPKQGISASILGAKAETAKPANKWGDLDTIGAPGAKSAAAPSSASPPGIDPFVTQPTPPPVKTQWSDLDADVIVNPNPEPEEDSDSMPSQYPAEPSMPDVNPYASIDEGSLVNPYSPSNSMADQTPAGKSPWGDLDSIGTPKAQTANQGGVDPFVTQPTPPPVKTQWGDLDSIGAPGSSPQPAAPSPAPAPSAGLGGTIGGGGGLSSGLGAKAGLGASGGLGTSASLGGAVGAGKGKWGDLESIGTPQAKVPPSAEDTIPPSTASAASKGGGGKWGDLESIKAPDAPKADAGGAGKWGNLDSIPTPKKSTAPAPDLTLEESEPVRAPIVMGTSRGSTSPVAKQRFTESSEHSGRLSGLREGKSKSKAASIQIGWGVWGALIAIILLVAAIVLAVKFFLY